MDQTARPTRTTIGVFLYLDRLGTRVRALEAVLYWSMVPSCVNSLTMRKGHSCVYVCVCVYNNNYNYYIY